MITKLEIKNFKNIKDKIYEFDHNPIILAGPNELGKSNSINAIMWLITDTLLTDKYGVGENDVNSIVPNDHVDGMDTEVSITFDSGTKFTKRYITSYDSKTKKVDGHNSEWLINDVSQNTKKDFIKELYNQFNFQPAFDNLDTKTKEINLFVDPLYAFLKIEPLSLRKLLVSLGCSVSNQEMYDDGFQDLQPYEKTYLGKWDEMRADYKKKTDAIKSDIKEKKTLLKTYVDVKELKESTLKELNLKKENLIKQKLELQSGSVSSHVKDIQLEMKELEIKKEAEIQKSISSIDADIKLLLEKKHLEEERINNETGNMTKKVNDEIQELENKIDNTNKTITAYEIQLSNYKKSINERLIEIRSIGEEKNNLAIKLNAVISRTYNNYLTCPHCGKDFPFSEEDVNNFNEDKEADKTMLKESITSCGNKVLKLRTEVEKMDSDFEKTTLDLNALKVQVLEMQNEILAKKKIRENIESIPVDRSSILSFEKEIAIKNGIKSSIENDYTEYDQKINELKMKMEIITNENQGKIDDEIRVIDDALGELESELSMAYVQKSNWKTKQELESKIESSTKKLNDLEEIYNRVDSFIKTMVSKINQKATTKTGIDFVMLEENISNEGIKEVCYATVNGIPFKDINTAEKLKVGIKFIERLKEICANEFGVGHNSLPIIVDRLEGIDDLDKIKNLTKEQLICTRVMFFTKKVPNLDKDGNISKDKNGEIEYIMIPDAEKNRTITVL